MQKISCSDSAAFSSFSLPSPHVDVLPGVPWGRADEVFSSAYWAAIGRMTPSSLGSFRIGRTLREEVAACLLGGYGMRAEAGLAAFSRLQALGLLEANVEPAQVTAVLAEQIPTRSGGSFCLRFARKKANYLTAALQALDKTEPPEQSGRLMRDWLRELPGIGWKTASWITRNWLAAEDVAILDVHIMRAGVIVGLFPQPYWRSTDYLTLEARFLTWASALGLCPANLDALIWNEMRHSSRLAAAAVTSKLSARQQEPCLHP